MTYFELTESGMTKEEYEIWRLTQIEKHKKRAAFEFAEAQLRGAKRSVDKTKKDYVMVSKENVDAYTQYWEKSSKRIAKQTPYVLAIMFALGFTLGRITC